jgi:hypothetical protein
MNLMSLAQTGPRSFGEIRRKEWIAAVLAGIGGIVNGGLIMSIGGGELFEALGAVGLVAIFGLMTLAFPFLVVRFTNFVAFFVIFFSSEFGFARSIASTLVSVFGLASATTFLAFVYVGAFWIVFGVFVLPLALGTAFPYLSFSFFLGCATFALFLGGLYGIAVQDFL